MINIRLSRIVITTTLLFCLLLDHSVHAHGFTPNTLLRAGDGQCWWTIEQTAHLSKHRKKQYVTNYNTDSASWTRQRVTGGAYAYANCCCRLSFDENSCHNIICSLTQLFYRATDAVWVPAYELKIGDVLLAEHNQHIRISNLILVKEPLKLHTIQVEETHTFLVGAYGIVAHNMLVPVSAIVGLSIPFGAECGGSLGSLFGQPGVIGGIVIG